MTKEEIEQQEREEEAIRAENVGLLAAFKDWLTAQKLTPKTIGKHVEYTEMYMDYLLDYDTASSKNYEDVGSFLEWYDRKVMFGSSKEAYSSLKKYYAFLYENKMADDDIMEEIKEAKGYFD
jgi:site-specific recombinase XerD